MPPIKRKRRSVKRPKSGNRITQDQYDALAEAYFQTQNVAQAADNAGVTYKTASKYVNKGDSHFPAIKDRLHKINETAIAAQDAHQVERRRFILTNIDTMLDQAAGILSSIDLTPTGLIKEDADGEPIITPDGKKMVMVNTEEFERIIAVFDKLASLRDRITGESSNQNGPSHQITQVNILDKESVAAAGQAILRKALGQDQGKPGVEEDLRGILAGTASRRVVDVTPDDT